MLASLWALAQGIAQVLLEKSWSIRRGIWDEQGRHFPSETVVHFADELE